jgi:large subunit ribosomal protein L15
MPIGPFRTYSQPINLRDLEARFDAGAEVSPESLVEQGLLKNTKVDVKILGSGELTKQLAVSAHGFSRSAKEKIEAAGGSVTWLRGEPVERKPKVKARKPVAADLDDDDVEETQEADATVEPVEESEA